LWALVAVSTSFYCGWNFLEYRRIGVCTNPVVANLVGLPLILLQMPIFFALFDMGLFSEESRSNVLLFFALYALPIIVIVAVCTIIGILLGWLTKKKTTSHDIA